MRRVTAVVFALALGWIGALILRGQQLGLDEIEFFRATRWLALGEVPYLDFWEHHAPLQWFVFAPIAWFVNGPGAESIVLMRVAQIPLWIALLWMLRNAARRMGISERATSLALLLLLLAPTFIRRAVEYRVDVVGNVAFIGAIALVAFGASRTRWIAFGALMSAAVLANMRLAPLVVYAGIIALFWRADERRWRWNPPAFWMSVGIAAVAGLLAGYLAITRSRAAFWEGIVDYNRLSNKVITASTIWDALFAPLWNLDVAGTIFWILGIIGLVMALRNVRDATVLQVAALLVVVAVVAIAPMEVHYDYHFQTCWLLLLPLAASTLERAQKESRQRVVVGVAVVALFVNVAQTAPGFGGAMRYQDEVMTTADRFTSPNESVLDGAGYALRRRPAYRYWFLATGVRFLAAEAAIERYDAGKMVKDPPAAIITDYRLFLYFRLFPDVGAHAMRHYVPVYRNLWLPGMTANLGQSLTKFVWIAPKAGRYQIWTSELLAKHPWLTRPSEYMMTTGSRAADFEIPLQRLPRATDVQVQWIVDGKPQPMNAESLQVQKGSRVELVGIASKHVGVLLVPHGITTLCKAPEEEITF